MSVLRLVFSLGTVAATQAGLWLALCRIFALRPRGRRLLLIAQLLLALFFVAFLAAARNGAELAPALRVLVVEPLLAFEALTLPLLLVLGVALSVARRLPRQHAGRALEPASPRQERPAAIPGSQPAIPHEEPLAADPRQERLAAIPPSPPAAPRDALLSEPRRIFLARAATGLLAGAAGIAAFGIAEAEQDPELTRRDVFLRGLPRELDGVTVLQLSDIHAGALMTQARMAAIARAAMALAPDVVVLTGDLFDVSARAAAPFTRAFRDLHGRLGTFAILGNHDYFAGAAAVQRAVEDAGIRLLRNGGARVERSGASLWIGGVDDPSKQSYGPDPAEALRHAAPGETRIVLAHRPSLFDECARAGAQLVLSGHTHGGQFALSPRWSLARALGPYTMGHFEKNGAQLYVHRGMGTVGPVPMRVGSPPEIALLTLRRS